MIVGSITAEGVPVVGLSLAGSLWSANVATGFNGDLELPASMQTFVNARFLCRSRSLLAVGQIVEEHTYLVDFPFDGQTYLAEATFVTGSEILIGTHLLTGHRLDANFHTRQLLLERVA